MNAEPATVLVVDDDLTILDLLLHFLSASGFKILITEGRGRNETGIDSL